MKIYFAASIRGGRDDAPIYAQILAILQGFGTVLTEHVGSLSLSSSGESECTNQQIHDRDLAWVREADCVIAEVTNPSLGVGYEIAKAAEWQKPVICLYRPQEGKKLSAMIAGSGIPVLTYVDPDELERALRSALADIQAVR